MKLFIGNEFSNSWIFRDFKIAPAFGADRLVSGVFTAIVRNSGFAAHHFAGSGSAKPLRGSFVGF